MDKSESAKVPETAVCWIGGAYSDEHLFQLTDRAVICSALRRPKHRRVYETGGMARYCEGQGRSPKTSESCVCQRGAQDCQL
jgi:hypothetical protein